MTARCIVTTSATHGDVGAGGADTFTRRQRHAAEMAGLLRAVVAGQGDRASGAADVLADHQVAGHQGNGASAACAHPCEPAAGIENLKPSAGR